MSKLVKAISDAHEAGLNDDDLASYITSLTDEYREANAIVTCAACSLQWRRSELLNGTLCPNCGSEEFCALTYL
jgi:DNA-directed RNA polymerase subunit RPC12/RpoP